MNIYALALNISLGSIVLLTGFLIGFSYPATSPLLIGLTISYFLVASVVTFDIILTREKTHNGQDFGTLPRWTVIFYPLQWILFATIAILNWKYALLLFFIKFILKFIPVLEIIGNILMTPFRPKQVSSNQEPE